MDEVDSCGSHIPTGCCIAEMFLHEDLAVQGRRANVQGNEECMLIETATTEQQLKLPPKEAKEELLGIRNGCAMLCNDKESTGSQIMVGIGNQCLSSKAVKCNSRASLVSCLNLKSNKDQVVIGIACEAQSKTSHGKPDHKTCDTITHLDHIPHLIGGQHNYKDLEFTGTDETDQGQIVPTVNLTENHSEHFPEVTKSQYYANPPIAFLRSESRTLPSDNSKVTTVKESSGLKTAIGNLQTEIGGTLMPNEETPSCPPSCAISQSAAATTHLQAQQEPSIASADEPLPHSEDLKRKMGLVKGQQDEAILKRQKISQANQSDVQYNSAVPSMPREYSISGVGNYMFDSPNSCTFNLYQKPCESSNPKQHAFEWASLCTQTDSPICTAKVPVQPLETIAKLIAQTTDWKKFARCLPMTECGKLEADIRSLEACQGTTSDKTSAVLLRWWRGHPQQLDHTAMKNRLKEGLESCSLIRLARTLDSYL